jgi:hypothetical protein
VSFRIAPSPCPKPGIGWFAFARKDMDAFREKLMRHAAHRNRSGEPGRHCDRRQPRQLQIQRGRHAHPRQQGRLGRTPHNERKIPVRSRRRRRGQADDPPTRPRRVHCRTDREETQYVDPGRKALITNGILKTERHTRPINRCQSTSCRGRNSNDSGRRTQRCSRSRRSVAFIT